MLFIKDVSGSEEASAPLVNLKGFIAIHTNSRPETFTGPDGTEHTAWVYDEKQYTQDEYDYFLSAVNQTKEWMNEELNRGLYYEGKYYTITLEKQNLLSSQLSSYMVNNQRGRKIPLTWNATGEASTKWTYENLLNLSNAISDHVEPIVKRQQDQEVKIREANSIEEIQKVMESFQSKI